MKQETKEVIWAEVSEFATGWHSLHDCVWETTGVSHSKEELKELFLSLPDDLIAEALEYGLSDTCWREAVYKHLKDKTH